MDHLCEICIDKQPAPIYMCFNECGCTANIHTECMRKWEEKHKDEKYLPCPKCMKPIVKMKCYCSTCALMISSQ